jgi:hypothetical protein
VTSLASALTCIGGPGIFSRSGSPVEGSQRMPAHITTTGAPDVQPPPAKPHHGCVPGYQMRPASTTITPPEVAPQRDVVSHGNLPGKHAVSSGQVRSPLPDPLLCLCEQDLHPLPGYPAHGTGLSPHATALGERSLARYDITRLLRPIV